jgi:hypothetical protein
MDSSQHGWRHGLHNMPRGHVILRCFMTGYLTMSSDQVVKFCYVSVRSRVYSQILPFLHVVLACALPLPLVPVSYNMTSFGISLEVSISLGVGVSFTFFA